MLTYTKASSLSINGMSLCVAYGDEKGHLGRLLYAIDNNKLFGDSEIIFRNSSQVWITNLIETLLWKFNLQSWSNVLIVGWL